MLWHFSGTYLDTGSVSLSSCRDAEQCWLKPGISPGSWSILQCSDYSIFFSIIFNWKTTWAVEISCEMKILSDFTPIASEHPIEDICFSMPTIVPRSQCFNSKILMGLVRRSSKQKFRRSFREKIKPFLFSKMVVFCNFPSKKKVKKKSLAITFLRWISIFCWKTSTITSPFPVMPTKRRSASAYMFAGAVPRTYHYSSKLFYLLSEYK